MSSGWLTRALEESRARGYLGPGPIQGQVGHSAAFAEAWEAAYGDPPSRFLDLGSGGGLPGLYLLDRWRGRTEAVLLDAMSKRTEFLEETLGFPEAPSGATVVTQRAEEAAWRADLSGVFDLVTARSFGPPAAVAECACRFLRLGGVLLVSDPPDAAKAELRWDDDGLALLGLESRGVGAGSAAIRLIVKLAGTPDRYPRRNGVPRKKPLF